MYYMYIIAKFFVMKVKVMYIIINLFVLEEQNHLNAFKFISLLKNFNFIHFLDLTNIKMTVKSFDEKFYEYSCSKHAVGNRP